MEASVGAGVEIPVGSDRTGPPGDVLRLRLLGPLAVTAGGVPLELPASRKVRALLGFLTLASRPVTRTHLCELLWEVPADPRGELRWCLSKIRRIVDRPDRRRLDAGAEAVRLDLAGCAVDALDVARAAAEGLSALATEELRTLAALFAGDLLDGLDIDHSPAFTAWLLAQRRRFREHRISLLEHLVTRLGDEGVFRPLETWIQVAPFDTRPHQALLAALARHGRIREAEEHLAAVAGLFDAEGLDSAPLRDAWRRARTKPQELALPRAATLAPPAAGAGAGGAPQSALAARRASVAVMPFGSGPGLTADPGGPGDGLAHDVITRLAKLRSLFVIARGTAFALRDDGISAEAAGRMLNVDYVVSGWLGRSSRQITVAVELADVSTAHIVWADVFDHPVDEVFLVLDRIGDRITACIDREIEASERSRALLRPPGSLDAWAAHHRGLWHMYRFSRADNDQARHFFEAAVQLDPTFSRAWAGLSFTFFQDAFQGWAERALATDRAFAAAGQSLMADDRDPAAHWAVGRAYWLRRDHDQALDELRTAVDLSPNFAQGHYTLAFVQAQAGDAIAAVASADLSRRLSPFDPMLFGMLGARAMALVRLGRFDEAADWGTRAAARPNAHAHIQAIAAYTLALAGRPDEGRAYIAAIRRALPSYTVADFFAAMQFSPDGEALFRRAAKLLEG